MQESVSVLLFRDEPCVQSCLGGSLGFGIFGLNGGQFGLNAAVGGVVDGLLQSLQVLALQHLAVAGGAGCYKGLPVKLVQSLAVFVRGHLLHLAAGFQFSEGLCVALLLLLKLGLGGGTSGACPRTCGHRGLALYLGGCKL